MTPFEVTVLSVTLNAAGIVPSANNRFPTIPVGRVRSYREVSCASARYRRDQLFCIVVLCHCGDSLRVKNHPYAKTAGSLALLGTSPDQHCSRRVRVREL